MAPVSNNTVSENLRAAAIHERARKLQESYPEFSRSYIYEILRQIVYLEHEVERQKLRAEGAEAIEQLEAQIEEMQKLLERFQGSRDYWMSLATERLQENDKLRRQLSVCEEQIACMGTDARETRDELEMVEVDRRRLNLERAEMIAQIRDLTVRSKFVEEQANNRYFFKDLQERIEIAQSALRNHTWSDREAIRYVLTGSHHD